MNKYTIVNGELYHYGVPGMKWGVRKEPIVSTQNTRSKHKMSVDALGQEIQKEATKRHATAAMELYTRRIRGENGPRSADLNDEINKAEAMYRDGSKLRKNYVAGKAAAGALLGALGGGAIVASTIGQGKMVVQAGLVAGLGVLTISTLANTASAAYERKQTLKKYQ